MSADTIPPDQRIVLLRDGVDCYVFTYRRDGKKQVGVRRDAVSEREGERTTDSVAFEFDAPDEKKIQGLINYLGDNRKEEMK